MLLVAFFYYENEKRLYFDLSKSKMQNISSQISRKIVYAHMINKTLNKNNLLKSKEYKVAFYDVHKEKLFGQIDSKVDFKKTFFKDDKHYVLIDDSALGHGGIYYIVIEEKTFFASLKKLELNIFIFFLSIYFIISLIGYYLAKMFLRPIKEERIKLKNFIKDTTHELNTPISAILMSTETSTLNEKQIERVRISARRISEIYKDLTYLFLKEAEDKKALESIRIDELIKEQIEYFEVLCLRKKIKISLDLEEFTYKIHKDDFLRVFNNILSNAVKYNKISGKIDITLENKILKIKDSGIGIAEDKIKDIFKRYYRATSQQGGFGIGLSIVKSICLNNNISVEVSSKVNEGSTFTLDFKI